MPSVENISVLIDKDWMPDAELLNVRSQGVKFGVATDLGYVTDSIRFHLRRADLLLQRGVALAQ